MKKQTEKKRQKNPQSPETGRQRVAKRKNDCEPVDENQHPEQRKKTHEQTHDCSLHKIKKKINNPDKHIDKNFFFIYKYTNTQRNGVILAAKDLRTNRQIRVPEVRLIDREGVQRGVLPTSEALRRAEEQGLDLVEIAPNSVPPVCRIVDYGKFRYEQEKRSRESKKKQTVVRLKEVRMQPKIDKHDLDFKTKHIRGFLDEGAKVKVTIRFRGRELAHPELGKEVLDTIVNLLTEQEVAFNLDKPASMEGKMMSIILSSKNKK